MVDLAAKKKLTPWTFDDLFDLPDDGWRYEIVDGSLVMTPPPGVWHEVLIHRISSLLRARLPQEYEIVGAAGINLHPSYRIPDLGVIRADTIDPKKALTTPDDLVLVVEVVSVGSESTDRVLKPAQYAAAGIPNYWRVETRPHTALTAYALPDGAATYAEVGTWTSGQTVHLTDPYDVDIPLYQLQP